MQNFIICSASYIEHFENLLHISYEIHYSFTTIKIKLKKIFRSWLDGGTAKRDLGQSVVIETFIPGLVKWLSGDPLSRGDMAT